MTSRIDSPRFGREGEKNQITEKEELKKKNLSPFFFICKVSTVISYFVLVLLALYPVCTLHKVVQHKQYLTTFQAFSPTMQLTFEQCLHVGEHARIDSTRRGDRREVGSFLSLENIYILTVRRRERSRAWCARRDDVVLGFPRGRGCHERRGARVEERDHSRS